MHNTVINTDYSEVLDAAHSNYIIISGTRPCGTELVNLDHDNTVQHSNSADWTDGIRFYKFVNLHSVCNNANVQVKHQPALLSVCRLLWPTAPPADTEESSSLTRLT